MTMFDWILFFIPIWYWIFFWAVAIRFSDKNNVKLSYVISKCWEPEDWQFLLAPVCWLIIAYRMWG